MAEKKMLEQFRMNPLGDCGGGRRDKAVDDHGDFQGSAADAYAGHRGYLETAESGEHRLARRERRAMNLERAGDHFNFAADAGVVESRAAPDHRLGSDSDKRAKECGSRGAVRDP